MAYTQPPTWTTAQIVTAADLNTYLTDNLHFLIALAKENIVVINDSNTNNLTNTTFAQLGSVALSLTTIDSYASNGAAQDTAVLLVAWVQCASTTAVDLRWHNNTTGLVVSILGPTVQVSTAAGGNINAVVLGVDRPATGANTYHVHAKVASGTGTINRVHAFAMEIMR